MDNRMPPCYNHNGIPSLSTVINNIMVQGSGHVMQLGCTAPQVGMVNDTYGLRKDLRMENTS